MKHILIALTLALLLPAVAAADDVRYELFDYFEAKFNPDFYASTPVALSGIVIGTATLDSFYLISFNVDGSVLKPVLLAVEQPSTVEGLEKIEKDDYLHVTGTFGDTVKTQFVDYSLPTILVSSIENFGHIDPDLVRDLLD